MPIGIPWPDFGWKLAPEAPPTLWVDNTNSACDDSQGTESAPLCDLFRGGSSVTLAAGTVVHIQGGPYLIDGDRRITFEGSEASPVIVRGLGGHIRFDAGGYIGRTFSCRSGRSA